MFPTTTIDVLSATITLHDDPPSPRFSHPPYYTFFHDYKRRLHHHHCPVYNRFRANHTNMHCAKLFNTTLRFGIAVATFIVYSNSNRSSSVYNIYIQYIIYIVVCCVCLPAHKSVSPLFTFSASLSHLTPCRSFSLTLFVFIVGY